MKSFLIVDASIDYIDREAIMPGDVVVGVHRTETNKLLVYHCPEDRLWSVINSDMGGPPNQFEKFRTITENYKQYKFYKIEI